MSADYVRTCPKCISLSKKKNKKVKYGKVPEKEYLKSIAMEEAHDLEGNYNLQENYDARINEKGIFSINYSGYCDECGFKFNYEHKEKVL